MLGTDFLYSWSLMWDSEELQTIVSQTLWYFYNRALSKPVFVLRFVGFSPGQTSHPLTQSCSESCKKQPKGCRAWLWCLVGNTITVLAPQPVLGVQSQPSRAGHSSQGTSVPLAGTHIRDSSRAVPDPGAREITAKSPWPECTRPWGSLTFPFHVPALSNSRGALCHCGVLSSLAPISGTLRALLGSGRGCVSPNKDQEHPEAVQRGREVPGTEPVSSRSLGGWGELGRGDGEEGSDGGARAGVMMLLKCSLCAATEPTQILVWGMVDPAGSCSCSDHSLLGLSRLEIISHPSTQCVCGHGPLGLCTLCLNFPLSTTRAIFPQFRMVLEG